MIRLKTAIIITVVVSILSAGAAFALPAVTGTNVDDDDAGLSPEKAAVLQAELERQQGSGDGAHVVPPMTPVESCPEDVSDETFVKPFEGGPFHPKHTIYFVNVARVFSSPDQPTWVYAGAISGDKEQGVLFVQDEQIDPCAAALGTVPVNPMAVCLTPGKWGRVMLTAISGESVEFTTDAGVKGSFDVVSHNFTVGGVVQTPLPTPPPPPAESPLPAPTLAVSHTGAPVVATPIIAETVVPAKTAVAGK